MRLKKLELFGFKTFPDATELVFHEGITAIVGPNGCGKSNIIDAIRWVMGETSAKGLRGDSMGDVIFSGSDTRKPLSMAEVTLTLTGAEGHLPDRFGVLHEFSVTRRLTRDGDSEYLINRVPCRLKDVTELFMDTGVGRRAYSVVEQGRIDAILAARPQERRHLIEEAAGITKYKSRREEAVRRMDETAKNLERLGDVIGEVRREMNALKRQAARAEEFRDLRSQRRQWERDSLVAAWLVLERSRQDAASALAERERCLLAARGESDRLGSELEVERLAALDEERTVQGRQRQVFQWKAQIAERESRLEFLRREVDGLGDRATRARQEASELESRRDGLSVETGALQQELQDLEGRLSERAGKVEALTRALQEARSALADAEKAVDSQKKVVLEILGELTRVAHGLDHSRRQEADAKRRLDGMGRQGAEVAVKLRELDEEIALRESELNSADEARALALSDRASAETALQDCRSRRQELARLAEEARKALHREQSRLKGLEQIKESLEWYGSGVRAVLKGAKLDQRNGIHGVVADTLSAPAPYESALEAALGERLQYVIVEDPERGLDAVQQLKSQRAGRSSFAPMNLRAGRPPVFPETSEPWARGALLDLIEVAPEYEAMARCLLGDVFVVETLDHALGLWRRNGMQATLVTLEGETVSPEGVISGGIGRAESEGLLRKNREIRELRATVARLETEAGASESALAALERQLEEHQSRLDFAREEAYRRDLQVANLGKDLAQLRERRERMQERREAMDFERDELTVALEQLASEVTRLEGEKSRLHAAQEDAAVRVEALQEILGRARETTRATEGDLGQVRVEEAENLQRREGLVERIRTLEASRQGVAVRIDRLLQEAEQCLAGRTDGMEGCRKAHVELEVLRSELSKEEEALSEVGEALQARREALGAREKAAAAARRTSDEQQRLFAAADLELRDLELQCRHVLERFQERQHGNLEEAARSGIPDGFDGTAAEARIRELDAKIAEFGEINLLAIEEHAERRERYDFLQAQKADLEGSLESLRQAIQRINRVSRERFADTFSRVNETFERVYPQIFRGGEARLILTDSDNLLETGVDIIARPPGKRPQHISLLSGGEKALTAIALIFSIFMVKPSPFCILDEVDAPLDEANVGRFTEMVKHMTDASQFLVITHNKSTMEAAEHLYGITMGEPGISRVVSVRLSEEPTAAAA